MVSGQLSALLLDWTSAVTELDISIANKLLEKEPELLWTPIPQSIDDRDHLQDHLVQLNKLGTSFQPMSAIQYTLIHYKENQQDMNRLEFLTYLIEQSSLHDLDTRFWGECNNTTLHLVCFLGHEQIVQLLIEKGVSVTPSNELGFIPKDVTTHERILHDLTEATTQHAIILNKKKEKLDRTKSTVVRPNYSTPDRFKLLRELAEESSVLTADQKTIAVSLDRKKSEVHYFRKGRVKETQQKVLTEEEVVELEKQRSKRQLEVAQLVKKSAVKNNPLFKKLEKRTTTNHTSPTPSPSTSSTLLNTEENTTIDAIVDSSDIPMNLDEPVMKPKRNSKVISSLKTKSYVSTSIFVQADEIEQPKPVIPSFTFNNNNSVIFTEEDKTMLISQEDDFCVTKQSSIVEEDVIYFNEPKDIIEGDKKSHHTTEDEEEDYYPLNTSQDMIESLGVATVGDRNSSHYSSEDKVLYPSNEHTSSDEDFSDNDDDEFEEGTPVQFATRLVSPIYKSVVVLTEEEKNSHLVEKKDEQENSSSQDSLYLGKISNDTTRRPQNPRSSSLINILSPSETSIVEPVTTISPTVPVRPQRSELRQGSSGSIKLEQQESKEKKRMSGSQKAAWTMSMSSWAAILDREFNLDEIDQEKKLKQIQQQHQSMIEEKVIVEENNSIDYLGEGKFQITSEDDINFDIITPSTTLELKPFNPSPTTPPRRHQPPSIVTTPLPAAPHIEEPVRLRNDRKSIIRKPIAASLSESTTTSLYNKPIKQHTIPAKLNIKHRGDHGKLYLHVNGIQDILLPLPKERAYVRCVVSDGRFEYMSRYEILSQNINFDYECVIDTHPDMIITISLHVRPDYVMKSRKPFSRLFSSKKKKESLSGYVNKEDGAIGQARFALAHMVPVCMESTYLAGFHCFNAWYSRTFKERHRQKKQDPDQDVLKVVGNFDVEMLYLPVDKYNKPFPRNLRECDLAIKQLHQSVEDTTEKYHTF